MKRIISWYKKKREIYLDNIAVEEFALSLGRTLLVREKNKIQYHYPVKKISMVLRLIQLGYFECTFSSDSVKLKCTLSEKGMMWIQYGL